MKFIRKLYTTLVQLSPLARFTLILICAAPSLLLVPLVLYIDSLLAKTIAYSELFLFARGLADPSQMDELNLLAERVFLTSPEFLYLSYAIIGLSYVGAAGVMLLLVPWMIQTTIKLLPEKGVLRIAATIFILAVSVAFFFVLPGFVVA